jgi:hypothetical protein
LEKTSLTKKNFSLHRIFQSVIEGITTDSKSLGLSADITGASIKLVMLRLMVTLRAFKDFSSVVGIPNHLQGGIYLCQIIQNMRLQEEGNQFGTIFMP